MIACCLMWEGAMAARLDTYLTCVALVLSAIATVATTPADGTQTLQKLRWLLLTSTAPEAVATAGATGGIITFPDPP
jgi:hypothetical protein